MNKVRSKLAGCLTCGLTALAVLFSFLSFIGRPDSMDDLSRGKIFDILILGPIWAATIFMYAYAGLKRKANGKIIAVILAVFAWVVSSSISASWEQKKVDLRLKGFRQMEEQMRNQNSLEQSVPEYPPQGVGSSEP
jgi:hypothetical protein